MLGKNPGSLTYPQNIPRPARLHTSFAYYAIAFVDSFCIAARNNAFFIAKRQKSDYRATWFHITRSAKSRGNAPMQNESAANLSKVFLAFIITCAVALGIAFAAPTQAKAADTIDVALTIADNTTGKVYFNAKISSLTASNTVRDLLSAAGYSSGTRADSQNNSHIYYSGAYGRICFLHKGDGTNDDFIWLNCLNGDAGCWDEVALNEKLQANCHYQYIFDKATKLEFEYRNGCEDPMPVDSTVTNPDPGQGGGGLIQLPTRPPAKPDPTDPDPGTEPTNPDPGTTDPGTPGPTNPDPGTTDPGTPDPGTPGPTNPDPGDTNPSQPGDSGSASTDISTDAFSVSLSFTSCTYNSKYRKPVVYVTNASGKDLVKDQDFTVSYSKNKLVGHATVTIKGIGKYQGTTTKQFTITPKSTSIRSTSSGKHYVKINYYKRTTQVTGYQVYISKTSNFSSYRSLSTTSNKVLSKTFKSLKSGTKYYVKVRTYKKVNGEKIYSSWSKTKYRYTTK